MSRKKLFALVFGAMVAGVLISSSAGIFRGDQKEPDENMAYKELVEEPGILNSNPAPCANVLNPAYADSQGNLSREQIPDNPARASSQKRCREYRSEKIEKLRGAIAQTDSPEVLARLFFLMGKFHYADAYDNRDIRSAELAVGTFLASLSHEAGSAEKGLQEFSYRQREYSERAINLLELLKSMEQDTPKGASQAPQHGESEESDKKEGGIDAPIVEPGVRP